MLKDGERIEYLNPDIRVIISKEHAFGTDALLLADFAAPKRKERSIDLGTGCGIIPFYWLRGGIEAAVCAVEVQDSAFSQLERSVEMNSCKDSLKIYHTDLRDLKGTLPFGEFDLVTMNPPYKSLGTGIISASENDKIARHDTMCTLSDLSFAASKLLRFGGKLCVCLKPERLSDIVDAMKKHNIEPKRLRFSTLRPGKAPWLLLIEGRLGGKAGMIVQNELYIEGDFDGYSEEMRSIIGSYYDGKRQKWSK